MIEEIINAIKQTEKEAEATLRKAKEEAGMIIEDARERAGRIKSDMIGSAKERAEMSWKEAEANGAQELLENERKVEEEIEELKAHALARTDEAITAVIRELT